MKHIIIILLMFFAVAAYSRPETDPANIEGRRADIQPRNERAQRLQREKVAFFTSEIDLTPEEAEVFWPLYNKFWKEKEDAFRKTQQVYHRILDHLEGEKKVSNNELKQLLERYIEGSSHEYVIQKKYLAQFERILPIEKVSRIYKAEEDFRMKMIHDLRKRGTPAQTGASKP